MGIEEAPDCRVKNAPSPRASANHRCLAPAPLEVVVPATRQTEVVLNGLAAGQVYTASITARTEGADKPLGFLRFTAKGRRP